MNLPVRIFIQPLSILYVAWAISWLVFAIGPLRFNDVDAFVVLPIIIAGLAVVTIGYFSAGQLPLPSRTFRPRPGDIRLVVNLTAITGLFGAFSIVVDRELLSGLDASLYSTLLRCAPHLIEKFEVSRTWLLYVGYVTFSMAYVSTALFWIFAEQCRRMEAMLAQLAIASPICYAYVYSGRLPIFLLLALLIGCGVARITRNLSFVPPGRFLRIKAAVLVCAFGAYSIFMSERRPLECQAMGQWVVKVEADTKVSNTQLQELRSSMDNRVSPQPAPTGDKTAPLRELASPWNAAPADYLKDLVELGLPLRVAQLSVVASFYAAHSQRTLAHIVEHWDDLGPFRGFYQVGILSPIERVFFKSNAHASRMNEALEKTGIRGFYASIWGAAYLDFGLVGGALYLSLFGLMARYSYRVTRERETALGPLLLAFSVAAFIWSPFNAPLGLSASALVFASILAAGVALDLIGKIRASV